jgi:predicted DNA binding protein
MSVLVELEVGADEFELGRLFSTLSATATIELDSLVPLPGATTPLVWITDDDHESLADQIGAHPTVHAVERIEGLSERSLYALEWAVDYDHLFRQLREANIHILAAGGSPEQWRFTLRFRTHKSLSAFHEYCDDSRIALDVLRVYNIPEHEEDDRFGLTAPQQEALMLAVREGYYDLPRESGTADLGDQLEISDQAVTERLRRGIATLVRNTLMVEPR